MSNPEQRGNPAKQAMDLIQSLEDKVREKNQTIDGLKGEISVLKEKILVGYVRANWSSFLIGLLAGAGMAVFIVMTYGK